MKFRRALAFILCFVLALPLIACNKDARGDGEDDPGTSDRKTYTITFVLSAEDKAGGAQLGSESMTVSQGKSVSDDNKTLPQPTYARHKFEGWFNGETKIDDKTIISGNITVTAKFVEAQVSDYDKNISTWSKPGHLYIHYLRGDHKESEEVTPSATLSADAPDYNNAVKSTVYEDWGLWLWPKNEEGRLFNAAWIDESGAVYDVELAHTYNDAGWDGINQKPRDPALSVRYDKYANGNDITSIGFQLFMISTRKGTGYWKNDGDNNYLPIKQYVRDDGSVHWFVKQFNVGNGKDYHDTSVSVDNPYANIQTGSAITYNDKTGASFKDASGNPMFIKSTNDNNYPVWTKGVDDADKLGVGYQIFIASFCDSDGDGIGDLKGIISKLDYLKDLNIDVIWLTPFQESTNYHGYDINDYKSVDPRFGTAADYRALVDGVHQRGMKIVMDFVLNHTSKANEWFVKSQALVKETREDGTVVDYRQFYSWINENKYKQLSAADQKQWIGDSYGYYYYSSFDTMPELNYDYQPVRDAILDVCDYWMQYGLDGFRLDAVKHIYMKNEVVGKGNSLSGSRKFADGASANGKVNYDYVDDNGPDGDYSYDARRNFNFYREFNHRLKSKYPNAFVVGETLDGWDARIAGFYQGIDSQFDFNLYYAIPRGIACASGVANGGSKGSIANITTYYKRGQQLFSAFNPKYVGGQFTSNHDMPRARNRVWLSYGSDNGDEYKKISTAQNVKDSDILLKMYYAANMTLPGLSWIYYGDEIGMDGVMQYTLDTGSTSSTASASHEDRVYRQPMKWKDSGNASFAIGYDTYTLELWGANVSLIDSVETQMKKSDSIYNWMKKLTGIRRDKGIGATATMVSSSEKAQGNIEYVIQGAKGKIKVEFKVGGTLSGGIASYSGTLSNGTTMSVCISNA
ncbi:MAG: hypothetical protein HDT28_08550 [Clostridiales bacterium]|nr:hypothetical protein [Clostridiales bacterium]